MGSFAGLSKSTCKASWDGALAYFNGKIKPTFSSPSLDIGKAAMTKMAVDTEKGFLA
jgi:hypothetical protein